MDNNFPLNETTFRIKAKKSFSDFPFQSLSKDINLAKKNVNSNRRSLLVGRSGSEAAEEIRRAGNQQD